MSIINHWPASFRALYGGDWPSTYVAFDFETSGYVIDKDVITEIGHVLVEDGKIVNELSVVLNWSKHGVVRDAWLRDRLGALERGMAAAGKTCAVNYERMVKEGIKPEEALAFYRDLFAEFQAKGILFAAHNGYGFDEKMLASNLAGFEVDPRGFSFGDNGLIDTDGLEKASQITSNDRVQPRPGDTLRTYFHRVKYTRASGVRSSLEEHCFAKYRFDRYGVRLDQMHGALVDSRCVHYLMEAHRAQITAAPGGIDPPWIPPTPANARPAAPPTRFSPPTVAAPPAKRVRGQRRS